MCFDDSWLQPWFAVQVRSGRERLTARHLRTRGYEVFLPCYEERRRWSDRIKRIERALFAGYLFCRVPRNVTGTIATAPGVVRIVGDGHGPLSIPASEIETIQRIVETRLSAQPCPFLEAGQLVRIDAGPLRGTEGIVLRFQDQRRLIVSIPLLQRSVAVEIDSEWVSVPQGPLLGEARCKY